MKILFLPNSHKSPPSRYRIWQFVEPLTRIGYQVSVRVITPVRNWVPQVHNRYLRSLLMILGGGLQRLSALWITRDIEKFDVVMMNRDLLPSIKLSAIEPWLCERNPRIIFDFDDAIFIGSRNNKLRIILPNFALITAGNSYLADFAKTTNTNVRIWPTVIDTEKYHPQLQRNPGEIRIGWSGSESTVQYCLPLLENIITKLSSIEDFEFIVITKHDPQLKWTGVNYRFIPWTPETEVVGIQQLDIGLMPLEDTLFQRGKCGLKALQYMAAGVPALVSPVGVNKEIVQHGKNGYHCKDEADWLKYLNLLIHDDVLRNTMGRQARKHVEEKYSINVLLPEMIKEFEIISTIKAK